MQLLSDESTKANPVEDAYERLFLAGVFTLMAAALYFYIWKYGRNVPFWDDWELVPVLSGHTPFSLAWLWTPHSEHSIPIVRLVVLGMWRLTGDLRAVMVLTSTLLCAVVWALLETTRRLRGHAAFTDAVFPLALLGWGLFENHIFAMQFFFVGAAFLALTVIVVGILDWRGRPTRVVAIALGIVTLPMFGAIGLAMLPCLLAWVLWSAIRSIREGSDGARRDGLALLAAGGMAAAIAVSYVIAFPPATPNTPRASVFEMLRVASEMLSTSIGQAGQRLWPLSAAGALVVVAGAAVLAARTAWRDPEERSRALLVLAGIGASLSLVAAIAFGRAGYSRGQGFSNRYALFSSALLCVCYLCFSMYARGGLSRFVRTGIMLALTAAFVTNTWAGIAYGIDRADGADALIQSIEAGAPSDVAATRHAERVYPDPRLLAERLEMLRVSRSGPFARPAAFPGESACLELEQPLAKLGENQIYLDGATFKAVGDDPFVVYALPKPEYVCGIRLRFTLTNASPKAPAMQLFWADSARYGFREGRRSASVDVERTTVMQERTIWIYDTLDRLRIDPDNQPCTFELHGITLLVRESRQ